MLVFEMVFTLWYNKGVVNNIKGVDSMKKLDSIELLHANGDSTVIEKDGILDIVIDEVTKNFELNDEYGFNKVYSCAGFHLEIYYNDKDEDKEVVERLMEHRDLAAFILHFDKTDKVKEFELPYIEESDEDQNNIFEVVVELDVQDIINEAEEGDRVIAIDISMENLEFIDEGVD